MTIKSLTRTDGQHMPKKLHNISFISCGLLMIAISDYNIIKDDIMVFRISYECTFMPHWMNQGRNS